LPDYGFSVVTNHAPIIDSISLDMV
jgi:hypothetical protein